MKFSLSWLKDYVDIPDSVTPQGLAETLTLHVAEVEEVIEQAKGLDGVVVGEVLEFEKHPNADKLHVAKIDIGKKEPLQLIFGQMVTMHVGDRIPVAVAPTTLPTGIRIEKKSLRGVESQGMLCLEQELGLKEEGVSILYFPNTPPGTPIVSALGLDDVIFDIENKSLTNRPDLWGHYGMAREIAALYKIPLKPYVDRSDRFDRFDKSDKKEINLKVDIQALELCKRYMGVVIEGITIGPSPDWMQRRLRAVGQRPIGNIVDITNYIMFDVGEPTHAFDKAKLTTHPASMVGSRKPFDHLTTKVRDNSQLTTEVIIRKAKQDEKIITLDGVERVLQEDMLVIADSEKPIAIAGVMGGENTGVDDSTTSIILEVANFDGQSIRKTSHAMGLRTEGSARWEKRLDPHMPTLAAHKALKLIQEMIPGAQIVSDIVDVGDWKTEVKPIEVPVEFINKKIGGERLSTDMIKGILERLGFGVEILQDTPSPNLSGASTGRPSSDRPLSRERDVKESSPPRKGERKREGVGFLVTPPSWRATGDINIPEDIVEEIARIVGYNTISLELPVVRMHAGVQVPLLELIKKLKEYLALGAGLSEVQNYSFVSAHEVAPWGFSEEDLIAMENPPASDAPYMRPTLLPGIWSDVERNAGFFDRFGIFEIGSVFLKTAGSEELLDAPAGRPLPQQPIRCAAACVGAQALSRVKGIIESIGLWGGWNVTFEASGVPSYLDSQAGLRVSIGGQEVGVVGFVNQRIRRGVRGGAVEVAIFELTVDALANLPVSVVKYKQVPHFPPLLRDIAFVVKQELPYRDVVEALRCEKLLVGYELFDVYRGEKIGAGKKSMAFHLEFRDPGHTLTDEEVRTAMGQIIVALQQKFNADIRS